MKKLTEQTAREKLSSPSVGSEREREWLCGCQFLGTTLHVYVCLALARLAQAKSKPSYFSSVTTTRVLKGGHPPSASCAALLMRRGWPESRRRVEMLSRTMSF